MASAGSAIARNWVPITIFVLLAAIPLLGLVIADRWLLSLMTRVMIFAIAALSLDLILGYGALVSFGHAAFLGLGGYAVGILMAEGMSDATLSLPLALGLSALFALLTGAVCLRTKGVYFIMITLAFGQMAFFTATSLARYGGDDGLTLPTRSTVFGFRPFDDDRVFYYFVFACLVGAYLLCRAIVASRFGRVLRGAKENPVRMQAIGFSPFAYQLTAYVIAGTICGLSGFLLANQAEFVAPAYMSWQRSGELIFMVVLGGMGTLHGAVIGAIGFLLMEEWLPAIIRAIGNGLAALMPTPAAMRAVAETTVKVAENWKVVFGPILILIVLFARGGLLGLIGGKRG